MLRVSWRRYWNGQRQTLFADVPYATARDACTFDGLQLQQHLLSGPGQPPLSGHACVDLRGTGFGVSLGEFARRGCRPWGVVAVPLPRDATGGAVRASALDDPVQQHVLLYGGGFAGRLAPYRDRTHDEVAVGDNFDDEGRNGGWVLNLKPLPSTRASSDDALHVLTVEPGPVKYVSSLQPTNATGAPVLGLLEAFDGGWTRLDCGPCRLWGA